MGKRVLFGSRWTGRFAGAALFSSAVLGGCNGILGAPGTDSGGPEGPGGAGDAGGTGGGANGGNGTHDGPGGPEGHVGPSAGLRRLNVNEYRATVHDLLGVEALQNDALQADTRVAGFSSIGASHVAYSAQQIEQFEQASYDIARQVFDDGARRLELVGCQPASGADPCVRDFLSSFGRRAFRRPLAASELDAYAALVTSVAADSDLWSGLTYAVAAILQAPSFLYRVELGEPGDETSEPRQLTAFEVATRLSYLVTGSTPDDELLDAAESGALDTEEGLAEQLERLLESPRAQSALMIFLEEQLDIDQVSRIDKVLDLFPTFSPALAQAMQHEMYEVVADVAFKNPADLLSLLTRRDTFVNGPLAELYGLPGPASADEWIPVTLPEDSPRAGLLGFAGFLASHAGPAETSVTERGLFVTSKLLCKSIPSPPADVATVLPSPPAGQHITMRERVEQHMSDPACFNCHSVMDPPGLALEHFDALGLYRDTDNGLTIDATGEIDGLPFDGARELSELLAEHPDVSACFARRFYEFALGTQVHRGAPVEDLVDAFERSGRQLPELVRALVKHDVFRLVSAPR